MTDTVDTEAQPPPDGDRTDDETNVVVTTTTSAPPVQVWDVIVSQTGSWWGEPYLGPEAGTMRIQPELGGKVFNGRDVATGTLHGTVRAFDPPERLEIGGVLVPGAYAGGITITVEKTKLGSEIRVEQMARGRIAADVEDRIAHGWTQMASTLAELAES
ncbi:MAG: SRPBCC domain-containing protein [Acidimicrobiales bacterium]|nr:SRPBCC domain-containing protein [Acidimicrobiales bacterium]